MKTFLLIVSLLFLSSIASGQPAVMPIVSGGVVIGGVQNGRWLSATKTIPFLRKNSDFFLISQNGLQKTIIRGTTAGDAEFCDETRTIEFDRDIQSTAIGSNIAWNPFPRPATKISKTVKSYQGIVSNYLKSRGMLNPKIVISQILRSDLNGDGTDEFIISANHFARGDYESPRAGDYSFVLLRKLVNGKPKNFLLDGVFFPRRDSDTIPTTREIDLIADLNGDGKMEIWVEATYYEGGSSFIFELRGDQLTKVLEMGCGL